MADLEKLAKSKGIKYFLISFTDLFGGQRSKLVPAAAINAMAKAGAGFAGFATWLDMTPADSDMFVLPDPDSLIQLPWKPEVGWFAGNPVMDGKEVEHAPRNILRKLIAADLFSVGRDLSEIDCNEDARRFYRDSLRERVTPKAAAWLAISAAPAAVRRPLAGGAVAVKRSLTGTHLRPDGP